MRKKACLFVRRKLICLGSLSVSWSGQCVLGVSAADGREYASDLSEYVTSSKVVELARRS